MKSLAVVFARDGQHVHIVPVPERAHAADSPQCWCTPRVEFVAPNGGRIYLHRKANDASYPDNSLDAAKAALVGG